MIDDFLPSRPRQSPRHVVYRRQKRKAAVLFVVKACDQVLPGVDKGGQQHSYCAHDARRYALWKEPSPARPCLFVWGVGGLLKQWRLLVVLGCGRFNGRARAVPPDRAHIALMVLTCYAGTRIIRRAFVTGPRLGVDEVAFRAGARSSWTWRGSSKVHKVHLAAAMHWTCRSTMTGRCGRRRIVG